MSEDEFDPVDPNDPYTTTIVTMGFFGGMAGTAGTVLLMSFTAAPAAMQYMVGAWLVVALLGIVLTPSIARWRYGGPSDPETQA